MLSKQEIFNKVWNHFVVNKNPKSSAEDSFGDPQCYYIFKKGDGTELRCAIGLLIEDGEYNSDLEGKGICLVLKEGLLPQSFLDRTGLSDDNSLFFQRLQSAHDESSNEPCGGGWYSIEGNLRRLARDYALGIPRDERMSY